MMTIYSANKLLLAYAVCCYCHFYFIGLIIPCLKRTLGRVTDLDLKLKFQNFSNTILHIPLSIWQPPSEPVRHSSNIPEKPSFLWGPTPHYSHKVTFLHLCSYSTLHIPLVTHPVSSAWLTPLILQTSAPGSM